MNPELSIIVVNYKERGFLRQFLRGIVRVNLKLTYEILVVDNGSNDGSAEMMRESFPHIRLLAFPKNRGLSVAVNAAVRATTGKYILYINNDIAVFEGVIEQLVQYIERHPAVGILAPKLLNPDRSIQISCYRFHRPIVPVLRRSPLGKLPWAQRILRRFLMLDWDHNAIQTVDWVLGAAMLIRRSAYEQVGGMDERFFAYFEDVDLCRQMWVHKWQVVYYAPAHLIHYHQRTSAASPGLVSVFKWHTRVHILSGVKYFLKYFRQPLPITDTIYEAS
ncbi:MAG: glycosyltransferase family 2 protein [Candidatus Kerfeldbacteria bacterium]|nr:glycosyltransferase family 2 protein [Candidatus Kerfeldbacteria bacterium]